MLGLDSCLSISGWFHGREWSVQTCADTTAVVEMLDKDESCAFLQVRFDMQLKIHHLTNDKGNGTTIIQNIKKIYFSPHPGYAI